MLVFTSENCSFISTLLSRIFFSIYSSSLFNFKDIAYCRRNRTRYLQRTCKLCYYNY